MADGQEGTPAVAVAEPAVGQTAPVTSPGTQSQNGPATTQVQSAPAEESFSSIDPKTLSPELQAVYKNLQSDYTKKTMSIADVRKKADAYDKVSKDPKFVDYWNGLNKPQKAEFKEQKAEAEKTLGQKITDEEFTKSFESKDAFLSMQERIAKMAFEKSQQEIQQLKEQLSQKEANDVMSAFIAETGKDGQKVRPDFDALDEDGLITGFLRVNPPQGRTQKDYISALNEAYSWAKATSQKYYEKGKSEALARIQQKAATSTEPPTQAAKGAYTGPKIPSVQEAIDLAKKGIRVPRND